MIRNFANFEIKDEGECVGWVTIMEKGESDLRSLLKEKGKMDLSMRKKVAIELKEGLEYLANVGINHRDRKPENVLVKNGVAKWIDFGMIMETSGRKSYRKMGYARRGSKYRNSIYLRKFLFEITL